jgi:hypothetical protein
MKKIHELILLGGLGNQLFILFKAYKLSFLFPNDRIYLNYSPILHSSRKDRPLQVEEFILRDNIILVKGRSAKIRYLIIASIFKIANKLLLIKCIYINIKYYKISYSYYQKISEDNMSEHILQLLQPLFLTEKINTLAVHVRRGDYLYKDHHMHGLVQMHAILNEVNYSLSKHNFDSLTIFTDSPDQVDLEQFSSFSIPVYLDPGGDSIEVFKRMCNANGIIGANSTFSFWAIILGNPIISSIPLQWNQNQTSHHLGFPNLRRYS